MKSSCVMAIVILLVVSPVFSGKPGSFMDADFAAPDYTNGQAETVDVGVSRLFTYSCSCARQNGPSTCSGSILLEESLDGSPFTPVATSACEALPGRTCAATTERSFSTAGIFVYRVSCDETRGVDYTQPPDEYVMVTAQEYCTDGASRPCPLQEGVCSGSSQSCSGGEWLACDYGSSYEQLEASCDGLDNDCDTRVDNVDVDQDGSSPCGSGAVANELFVSGMNNDPGNLSVFSFDPLIGEYVEDWSVSSPEIVRNGYGLALGDVTNDGQEDILIARGDSEALRAEVWTYNLAAAAWELVWAGGRSNFYGGAGGIGDYDGDGLAEFLWTNHGVGIEVWGGDGAPAETFQMEARIRLDDDCRFGKTACDLDSDGIPEILTQCTAEDLELYEWDGAAYALVAAFPKWTTSLILDDMGCGDLDGDGVDELLVCGNHSRSNVIEYEGEYTVSFTTPQVATFVQTCDIGDIGNDGALDFVETHEDGIRIFSYQNGTYQLIWENTDPGWTNSPGVAAAALGDSDNDGWNEFHVRARGSDVVPQLFHWQNDDLVSLTHSETWYPVHFNAIPAIGNLNPYNDFSQPDCDDTDPNRRPGFVDFCGDGIDQNCDGIDLPCACVDGDGDGYAGFDLVSCPGGLDCDDELAWVNPGTPEVCADQTDNDCNGQIDEGCVPVAFCGDGICAGQPGEDGFSCRSDCPCVGPRCKNGNCGNLQCEKAENADSCPVDCG